MDEKTLKQLMDTFGNVSYKKDALETEKKNLIRSILTPEQLESIQEIEEEFTSKFKVIEAEEKSQRKILDAAVEEFAKSLSLTKEPVKFKSDLITASIAEGDFEWDSSGLNGFISAGHNELLQFRKQSKPKIRISKNKL